MCSRLLESRQCEAPRRRAALAGIAAFAGLLAFGCASHPTTPTLVVPPLDATSYTDPHGRKWVVHSRLEKPEIRSLILIPEDNAREAWTEMLGFSIDAHWTLKTTRESLAKIASEIDRTFSYEIQERGGGAVLLTYRSPTWNEKGVQISVPTHDGTLVVYYQTRLGPVGDERHRFWLSMIRALVDRPNSTHAPSVGAERERPSPRVR